MSTTTQSALSTTDQTPLSTTPQSLLPTSSHVIGLKVAIEVADRWLADSATLVFMDPYQPESLMRVNVTASHDDVHATADAIIDTTATLNFVNQHYLQLYGLTK